MHKAIVITSVYPASPSVQKWTAFPDWKMVVVGDKKTPVDWSCHPATYLSVTDQESAPFHIARILPWNHYARKLMGYLVAIQQGAEIILDTDDDNMPKPDWSIPEFDGNYLMTSPDRNVHHYLSDFESEIPCYLYPEIIMDVVDGAVSSRFTIETNLINAYERLVRYDLISKCEMDLLTAWVQDIQNMAGKLP